MKALLLSATIATLAASTGAEKQIKATAESLDQLMSQKATRRITVHGNRVSKETVTAVNLERASSLLAPMLKLDDSTLRTLLQDHKLSHITYARLLSRKTGEPMQEFLKNPGDDRLLRRLKSEQIPLPAVHSVLQNLYSEIAFLSLDRMMEGERVSAR